MRIAVRGLAAILAISLVLSSGGGAPRAWASFDSDYDAAGCNGTKTVPQVPAEKKSYCDAAKTADDGAKNDDILWKIWALVTGVCTTACLMSWMAETMSYVCTGSNVAAGVTDATMTKNYAGAMQSVTAAGMSLMMGGEGLKNSGSTIKDRAGSCFAALSSATMAFTKNMSAKSARESAKTNLENAKSYTSQLPSVSLPVAPSVRGRGAGNGDVSNPSAIATNSTGTDTSQKSAACGQATTTGGLGPSIACAVSMDSNLPSFVTSGKFLKELQDTSGKNPQELFSGMTSPEQGVQAALGSSMNPTAMGHISTALAQVKDGLPKTYDAPAEMQYASASGGGGSHGGSGGDDGMDMNAMLAGLMGQLGMGPKSGEQAPAGVSTVDFKSLTRPQQQVVEDRSLSIFTRVSFRYYYVGRSFYGGNKTTTSGGIRR